MSLTVRMILFVWLCSSVTTVCVPYCFQTISCAQQFAEKMAMEKRLAFSIVQFLRDQTHCGALNSDEQESLEGRSTRCLISKCFWKYYALLLLPPIQYEIGLWIFLVYQAGLKGRSRRLPIIMGWQKPRTWYYVCKVECFTLYEKDWPEIYVQSLQIFSWNFSLRMCSCIRVLTPYSLYSHVFCHTI